MIRAAEDGDPLDATVFTGLPQMAASTQHSRPPPHVASAGPSIPHAVLYRSVLMVQALERFHQLFRCSVQIPEWRPHISSPITGLGVVRGFPNKSIVFWLAPPQNQTLLLRNPPKFLQQWHFTVVLQNPQGASTYRSNLSMFASTKNSYIGCAASSCSASPDGGLHLWRSNSVVPTQCQHSPHGIFEWCRARVSGSSSQFPPETQSLGLPALPIRQHEALENRYTPILAPEFATFRAALHSTTSSSSTVFSSATRHIPHAPHVCRTGQSTCPAWQRIHGPCKVQHHPDHATRNIFIPCHHHRLERSWSSMSLSLPPEYVAISLFMLQSCTLGTCNLLQLPASTLVYRPWQYETFVVSW